MNDLLSLGFLTSIAPQMANKGAEIEQELWYRPIINL